MKLDPELLATAIHSLRLAVLVLWAHIAFNGLGPLVRIIGRRQIVGDRMSAVMLLLAGSLITFQCRALARGAYAAADMWTVTALLGLVMTAVCLYLIRCRGVADDHKRAAILSGLGLLLVSLTAGALS